MSDLTSPDIHVVVESTEVLPLHAAGDNTVNLEPDASNDHTIDIEEKTHTVVIDIDNVQNPFYVLSL